MSNETTTPDKLLKDVMITFYDHLMKKGKPAWYGTYELNVEGHTISGKVEYFKTMDEAVAATKEAISKAALRFTNEKLYL